jgi:hypothetical protein
MERISGELHPETICRSKSVNSLHALASPASMPKRFCAAATGATGSNYAAFSLNPLNDMVNGGATTYVGTVDGTHPVNRMLCHSSGYFAHWLSLGTAGTQQFLTQVIDPLPKSILATIRRIHPAMEP